MAHVGDRTFKMGVSVGMRASMITLTVVRIIPAAFVEKGRLNTIIILLKPLKEAVIFRRREASPVEESDRSLCFMPREDS